MRLSDRERQAIVDAFTARFADLERIVLFGSRVDDAARGGDIDLLVISGMPYAEAFRASLRASADVQIALGGERKIDVVIAPGADDPRLIVSEALRKGITLWTR